MKLITICLLAVPVWAQSQKPDVLDAMRPDPPMMGLHMAKGEAHGGPAGNGSSPNLINHNGPILPTTVTQAIFWGTSWNDPTFVGDKITGLDLWYSHVGDTTYALTSDEYTGSNGPITAGISYLGHLIDTTAAPSKAPATSTILGEVCKEVTHPVSNGYYAVYVDGKRGHAGYCAWHSSGSCGGTPVQFAFFFNLDGDSGCDPQDTGTAHSQGLAALANVTGHELSEARTDPQGTGWYDKSGEENADKCAWSFGSPYVVFPGPNSNWKIQGNWSNAAFNSQTGYGTQKGCVDGGNYKSIATQ